MLAHSCPGRVRTARPQLAKADTAFQAHPLVNRLNLALESFGLRCVYAGDISSGQDSLSLDHLRRGRCDHHEIRLYNGSNVQEDAARATFGRAAALPYFSLKGSSPAFSHSCSNSRGSHRRAPSLEKIIELVKVGSRRQLHAVLIATSLLTCTSQRSRGM